MDMFNEPRCNCCADKTQVSVKDNKITLSGTIPCCFVRGLLWYLRPCCFISYVCGGHKGTQLESDIRKEIFNTMPKKEAYVDMDGKKYMVYQVDGKMRSIKMPDHRTFVIVNDVVLTRPQENYYFISKKAFEGGD